MSTENNDTTKTSNIITEVDTSETEASNLITEVDISETENKTDVENGTEVKYFKGANVLCTIQETSND